MRNHSTEIYLEGIRQKLNLLLHTCVVILVITKETERERGRRFNPFRGRTVREFILTTESGS